MNDTEKFVFLRIIGSENKMVIGAFLMESDDDIMVKYPLVISYHMNNGTTEFEGYKYFPFAQGNKVSIKKNGIESMSVPNKNIIKQYLGFIEQHAERIEQRENGVVPKLEVHAPSTESVH